MANFTRLRASGLWVPGSTVLQAELEQIDDDRAKTINATDGSTHAPTTQIVIGGSGLSITGPAAFSNITSATASGAVVCNGTFTGNGVSFFNNTVTATGTVNGNTFNVTSANPITLTNPRTYTRPCRPNAIFHWDYWVPPGSGLPPTTYYNNSVANASNFARLQFDLDAPDQATIVGFSMWVAPDGPHVALPSNMPKLELYRLNRTTQVSTLLASATDTSPNTAAYEIRHQISSGVLAIVVDAATYSYILVVYGESGTNLLNDGQYDIPEFTYTRARLAEER